MVKFKTLLGLIVFGLVFSFGLQSFAKKTPDGMTPAQETVCDGLKGAAFRLCNAYCEAMDCDSDEGYAQHANACDKVLADYEKKTDGALPPCVLTCEDIVEECLAGYDRCLELCLACDDPDSEEACKECRIDCQEKGEDCVGDCLPPRDACDGVMCEDGLQCIDGLCCNTAPGSFCDFVPQGEICGEDNCPSERFGCVDSQTCCALICTEL